jgi:hypothetical protein
MQANKKLPQPAEGTTYWSSVIIQTTSYIEHLL